MKHYFPYQTAIGILCIHDDEDSITRISFSESRAEGVKEETPVIANAHRQIEEYLRGERQEFDLKLSPKGTSFQQKVWNALLDIPYGETRSYGQIAMAVGNPKAARAIGMANNRNPIPIIIPCHRVVGADGKLIGYAGGLDIKTKLLELEKTSLGK